MTTLWSGRFETAPDKAAFEWGSSFSFDRRLFEDEAPSTPSLPVHDNVRGAGYYAGEET